MLTRLTIAPGMRAKIHLVREVFVKGNTKFRSDDFGLFIKTKNNMLVMCYDA